MKTVSFIHSGGPSMASYRYRAAMPAQWLGATLNNWQADVLVLSKPTIRDVLSARLIAAKGVQQIVADFCDDHFLDDQRMVYQEVANLATLVICPTAAMADIIRYHTGRHATVVPEAYAHEESPPHCTDQRRLLWFGHQSNHYSLQRILPWVPGIRVVTNTFGAIQWSEETVAAELAQADIVVLPATAPGKSPNRAVQAIRAGCFVVAEPHRAIESFPGVWIGARIEDGIAWATKHPSLAQAWTADAQRYIEEVYSPERCALAWTTAIDSLATEGALHA